MSNPEKLYSMKILRYIVKSKFTSCMATLLAMVATACMDYGPRPMEQINRPGKGVFIMNEGNFQYGNASLSYYNPETKEVEQEVFVRVNGIPLGDVAQSMTIRGDVGYVVVNNSGVIFAIDVNTFEVKGWISPLTSPRYMHFLSDEKAYVTDLYAKAIAVVNPKTFEILKFINVNNHSSEFYQHPTEQMVEYTDKQGRRLIFTNCWSYDDKILVIDTDTDQVIDSITVCKQPTSLIIDKNNQIWTVNDGGYDGSPYGQVTPGLYKIDAESRQVVDSIKFTFADWPQEICMNGTRDTLYFINKSVYRLDVDSPSPLKREMLDEFYKNTTGNYVYGLDVDPDNSEVYIADAIDYVQPGIVYRISATKQPIDTFRVGIIPGAFAFKK
mgnify:FL=1